MKLDTYLLVTFTGSSLLLFGCFSNNRGTQTQTAKVLQYTAGGHVLGFAPGKLWVATREHALQIELVGSRLMMPKTQEQSPAKPTVKAQLLQKVIYADAWPGVTVAYDIAPGAIAKSTYTIAPGQKGNPVNQIRLRYNRPMRINASGDLLINFTQGEMKEAAPVAWQLAGGIKKNVPVRFKQQGVREVGFVADYDPRYALVIDPALEWNTFLGASGDDYGQSIAVDGSGNVYVAGVSSAAWGTPVRAFSSGTDAYAAKLDNSGTLVWNAFLGTSGDDVGLSITVDGSGNVYVTGVSDLTWGTLPVHAHGSGIDTFIAKLTNNGALTWNTFLGGSIDTEGESIAVDGSGNVYVAGFSSSGWGSPVRPYSGSDDAFVVKLTSTGSLAWNTFLGSGAGSGDDYAYALAVDGSGHVYVGGWSTDTWGSPKRGHSAGIDAFAAKLNSGDGSLMWNTFVGDSGNTEGQAIAVDGNGKVVMGGYASAGWGTPVRAFGGGLDAFIAQFNSSDGSLVWNTFLGGSGNDRCQSIIAGQGDSIYVGGFSNISWGAPSHAMSMGNDAFGAELNSSSGRLLWNTFMGGGGSDQSYAIALDGQENVYMGGYSNASWGAPVRPFNVGGNDAFIAKRIPAPLVSALSPRYSLIGSSLTLDVQGVDLLGTTTIKLQNSKNLQTISDTSHHISRNSLSAQFTLPGIPGLFDLVLTKYGLDYVFKSLFTTINPPTPPAQWRMAKFIKACNANTTGSLVIADANRDHETEIFVATGAQNITWVKKINATWSAANFLDTPGENFQQLNVLDGNGDGELELYAASTKPHLCQYEWGKPTPATTIGATGSPIAVGDADHDGIQTIYSTLGNGSGQGLVEWRWTEGNWTGNTVVPIAAGWICTSVVVGDADHLPPAHTDEVYAAWRDASATIYLYQYHFDGVSWSATSIPNFGSGEIKNLALADLEHDGQNEIYVANTDGKIHQIKWTNPGWSSTVVNSNSVVCNQIAVGDGDNDGQDEIYGAGQDGHAWKFSCTSGAWQPPVDLGSAGTTLTAIAVGDGENHFALSVYALDANGYLTQFQFAALATPTPLVTVTPTLTPTSTPTPGPTEIPAADKKLRVFHSQIDPALGELARIRWYQSDASLVSVTIYNLLGDKITTLADRQSFRPNVIQEITWDGRTKNGALAGNGIYVVYLSQGDHTSTSKIAVVK